jgi:hypothetical protein
MEKVIYSNKGGLGIILNATENEADFIMPKTFSIVNETLNPNDNTTLFGLFTEPVRYCGVLKEKENCMVFYLGRDGDLFTSKKYYSCFYHISPTRLANKYSEGTCRDLNWINGKWK